MGKLNAAKRQATDLANNADLSEKQKLKAISKAMRGSKAVDKPNKVYVVTHKTSSGSVGTSTGGKVCYYHVNICVYYSILARPLWVCLIPNCLSLF